MLKKIFSICIMIVMGLSILGCLVGCQNGEENEGPRKDIYLKVSDNQGNIFYVGQNGTTHKKDLEYDYRDDVLNFDTEAFYENGDKCLAPREISFDQITIQLNQPGKYEVQQIYPFSDGPDVIFKLFITVKERPDERPVPTIEILPDEDCISYEMNKKYVYKYNGEMNMPKIINAYDTEHQKILIETVDFITHAVNAEIVEGDETNEKFVDVGVYKLDVYLTTYTIGLEGGRYAPGVVRDIIIEIIN